MTPLIVGLTACAALEGMMGPAEEPEPEIPEQCKHIHVDRLATDWTNVVGSTANPKVRLRIFEEGAGYGAYYIDGSFVRRTLKGVKRDEDVQFTEVPTDERKARVDAGEAALVRLYIQPELRDCALKAFIGQLVGDKEVIPPKGTEFVPMPQQAGVTFSYRPADEPLFLGEAATDQTVRDKQLAELGAPKPDVEMGAVAVGAWSSVDDDGDPACTYDMDLYFDDQLVSEVSPKPAAEAEDGARHWFHEWEAPFTGNHHFEMFRYRTCADGKRELIALAGIDAILL